MDPYDPELPLARRSILAYSSALIGVLAVLGCSASTSPIC
jgi:hypothetical protein